MSTHPAITSHEVARLAGVSQATVSRVLRGSSRVTRETRAKVEAVVASVGYRPNASARAMRARRTGIAGIVVDRITNPFYPQLLDEIGRALAARDIQLTLWDAAYGDGEGAALDALGQRAIDGLLFTTVTTPSPGVEAAIARGENIVLLNRGIDGVPVDTVDTDNAGGALAVARYLAMHDRRRVAFVGGLASASTARERRAGFIAGAVEFDLDLPASRMLPGDFSHASGGSAVARLLDDGAGLPEAIFCANDLSAMGVLDAARSHGIRVPDEMWVVGFDDIAMASWPAYDLTTAHQPMVTMAREGVELLTRRLVEPDASPEHRRLTTGLVVRGSTACSPAPAPREASGRTSGRTSGRASSPYDTALSDPDAPTT